MYYTELKKFPSAHITTGKQRLKQNGSSVYLNNGEEFEVEIFANFLRQEGVDVVLPLNFFVYGQRHLIKLK